MRPVILLPLAFAVALGGCDQFNKSLGLDPAASNTTANGAAPAPASGPGLATPTAPGGTPPKPATNDAALAAEVAQGVEQTRSTLPMRIDEITQVVGIRADGTEFVYDVQISRPVPDNQIETLRSSFQTQSAARLCANPDTAAFLRRGGSMNHRYSDPSGFRFETRVVSCP